MSDFELYDKSGTARALDNIKRLFQHPQDVHRTEGYRARFEKLQRQNALARVSAIKGALTDFDRGIGVMSSIRDNMEVAENSVKWLTDTGALMREKQGFYESIYVLAKERQQIKTIIDSFDDICSFQQKLSNLELEEIQDFEQLFDEIVELEKLSNKLQSSFESGDDEVKEKLEKFRDDVSVTWNKFESAFLPAIWQALSSNAKECATLLSLIQRRNQLDHENYAKSFNSYPRFLEDKAGEYCVDQILATLSAIDQSNIQIYLKRTRSDVIKLLEVLSSVANGDSYYILAYETCKQQLVDFIRAYIEDNKETIEIHQIGGILAFNKAFRADMEKLNENKSLQTENFKLLSDNDVINMKRMYFGGVSRSIKSWIEKNGKLEYDFWISDEEILQDNEGMFYTDMPFILQKLINDMMKAGLAISDEMRKPIFSVLVQETQQIRKCLFDFMIQLKNELEDRDERFFHCLFSMVNNTTAICDHFDTAKTKFKVDDVLISPVQENMDGLAKDAIQKFIIESSLTQLNAERDEVIVDDISIEIKWSDLISDRWFTVPDAAHTQLFFNEIDSILDVCQYGMSQAYFEFLVKKLEQTLVVEYIHQVINKRIDLSDQDEEGNSDKRHQYSSKVKQDIELINTSFDNEHLTVCLSSIATIIELDREILTFELPKIFAKFSNLTAKHIESILLVRADMNRQQCRELAETYFKQPDTEIMPCPFDPFTEIKSDSDVMSSVKDIKSKIGRDLTQASRRLTTGAKKLDAAVKIDASKEALQKGTANLLKSIRKTIQE